MKKASIKYHIIGGGISGLACAWFLKDKNADVVTDVEKKLEDKDQYIEQLLEENRRFQEQIDPNNEENAAPCSFAYTLKVGGLGFQQMEIWLSVRNNSDVEVQIGDFRGDLSIAGYSCTGVIPSNLQKITIQPKQSIRFRYYAEHEYPFQRGVYKNVRRALNALIGKSGTTIKSNTTFEASLKPTKMNLEYLWYWKGGEEECRTYNIVGDLVYKYAGWAVGSHVGYDAADKHQQKKNPSHWAQ